MLDGVVGAADSLDSTSTRVELLPSGSLRLGEIIERIRANDPRVVARFVRVLIAEDNTHVSELVKTGLATATRRELRDVTFGFDTAADGAAALELLRRQPFDAAIIDIYLPVLDGAAVIRHIRTTLGQPAMPVIALSGGGEDAREIGLRAGASTFLEKPVRLRSILETLRQLIEV
jgi:CheY-like chemotaxis protein